MNDHVYEQQRQSLLDVIRHDARQTERWTGRRAFGAAVMAAIGRVPRHLFVPRGKRARAYANYPLPIGEGQTISQPYIVALMTDLLDLSAADRVLEIGTGSGYQTAVLAEVTGKVYSVERDPSLAARAETVLVDLGYDNIHLRTGDGFAGWADAAPFDAILVTAAPTKVPDTLSRQLTNGGRMVIPIGDCGMTQKLMLIDKNDSGGLREHYVLPVAFVPMRPGTATPATDA